VKLSLQPTGDIERVQGIPCRVWIGETDAGVPVKAWVAIVQPQTHDEGQLAAFEAALKEMPYRRELVSFDHRMVD
jgi:hypothetical protein